MRKLFILVCMLVLGIATESNAELTIIGTASYGDTEYKLIYDDGQGLVWLDYSSSYAYWSEQADWAASLNNPGELTYDLNCGVTMEWTGVWRLPATESVVNGPQLVYGFEGDPDGDGVYTYDFGHNRYTGEMNRLFYEELGNVAQKDTAGVERGIGEYGLLNTGGFENLLSYFYWSETTTQYGSWPGSRPPITNSDLSAWFFGLHDGMQEPIPKYYTALAIAVRPADVTVSDCPEPTIGDILEFFDESVDEGSLILKGCGRGMRRLLETAEGYIEGDNSEWACTLLKRCYKYCDGQKRPSDCVTGEATEELADMMYDLAESLECEWIDD